MNITGMHTSTYDPTKVLVVGGSYAGLSAALNLHDLFNGKPRSNRQEQVTAKATQPTHPIKITIVDERDGFCVYCARYSMTTSKGLTTRHSPSYRLTFSSSH